MMIVLEELGLDLSKGEHKAEEYTKHIPNGPNATLSNHKNGDLTVW